MKTIEINLLLKACLTCATEKKIRVGSKWVIVNTCPICGEWQPLFDVLDNISKDQALAATTPKG